MAMNRVQFQPGLSLPTFVGRYGTEAACEQALLKARWPNGLCARTAPTRAPRPLCDAAKRIGSVARAIVRPVCARARCLRTRGCR